MATERSFLGKEGQERQVPGSWGVGDPSQAPPANPMALLPKAQTMVLIM